MLLKFSLSALALLAVALPAAAAEELVLTYGPLSRTVQVADIAELARSGEASPDLNSFLRSARQNPEEVRRVLNSPARVEPRLLDQVLNNPLGEAALGELSQSIRPAPDRSSPQALRAALVLSATQRQPFTLTDVLENYPTQRVYVDGVQVARTYDRFQRVVKQVESVLEILR